MNDNRQHIKQKLQEQLEEHTFQKTQAVLKRTHPKTWSERLNRWLNHEVDIPLVPASATVCALLLVITLPFVFLNEETEHQGELVDMKGSIYWSEMIEERLGEK
ncbi:hypothetical protein [Alkalihalobacterium chitinilyticum]|uniref:DUF4342 domain-containing protein n=1 Tax=Alkalihalobacterium chitinilyticum TaxID=2980103 RepID=A0ABT5VF34_9BACI|nr:hypothetical protein [Alkalihalobacterium chitinilyticum]MDE5414071.1 hypothetical protein [Alkalihalobacterium chitinilyticum]